MIAFRIDAVDELGQNLITQLLPMFGATVHSIISVLLARPDGKWWRSDARGWTTIMHAIYANDDSLVAQFCAKDELCKAHLDCADADGVTSMHLALSLLGVATGRGSAVRGTSREAPLIDGSRHSLLAKFPCPGVVVGP